jgi:CarD family transcriptional regulator
MTKKAIKIKAKAAKKIMTKAKTKTVAKKPAAKVKMVKKVVKAVAKKAVTAKKPVVAVKKQAPVATKVATKKAAPIKVAPKMVTRQITSRSMTAPVKVAPVITMTPRPNPMAPRMMQQRPMGNNAPAARPMMSARPGVAAAVAARPANDVPVDFRAGDYVVYPAHGVGTIEGVETQSIAGMTVTLYAISFEKDRMRLKIPVQKAQTAGLRKLSSGDRLKDALKTLTGKAKIKRTMWSRRAQEYEAKINSGDPVQIAEVLRDLRRPKDDTEQSYSERQIYQSALERLAREVAAVQRIAEAKAVEHLETVLSQAA